MPVFQKELEQQFIHSSVEKTNNLIKGLGFTPKINPRKLNLFYLDDNQRHRIVLENEVFKISNREFSKEQIIRELNSSPEKFSPNVLMRPLELVLIKDNIDNEIKLELCTLITTRKNNFISLASL